MTEERKDYLQHLLTLFNVEMFTRQVDQTFIAHLQDIHIEMGKSITDMWPCHQERLLELAGGAAVV